MIVNSEMKRKLKTMLWVITNLVFDFIHYFVSVYMRKNPLHLTSAQGTIQNTLNLFRQTIYNSNYKQKMLTIATMENERITK